MKKTVLLLVLSLLISSISMGFAQENDRLYLDGNKVERVFLVSNGNIREITIREYNKIAKDSSDFSKLQAKNNSLNIEDKVVQQGMTSDWYRYDESGNSVVLKTSERKRVSSVAFNGTTNPSTRSLSFSSSSRSTFSISLNSSEASAVRSGVGFSWESSTSITDTHTITMSPGEYSWLEFAPYKNKSWGHVKRFSWLGELENSRYVVTYSPREVGGDLDGILYHMASTNAP
ncbi:MAG: hypothetical protein ACLKAK_06155 [Alkaliphilus sp.]